MIKKLIISRTDGIGDVVLTLPIAGILKKHNPQLEIYFIGRTYTKPIVDSCQYVDRFLNWDEICQQSIEEQIQTISKLGCDAIVHVYPNKQIAKLAKKANVGMRIGTSHRPFHWLYCNRLLNIGRKKSNLHEAQLNAKLLKPLGIDSEFSLDTLSDCMGMTKVTPLNGPFSALIDSSKFNLILHPKSKGSAREWGLDNYSRLIDLLPANQFKIFVSGTESDRTSLLSLFEKYKDRVVDITGSMDLTQFIAFISKVDGLVAASTGPLHIAAALGKAAIGLYAPMRPIHPGRWAPIGENSIALVENKICNNCRKSAVCECIIKITPETVVDALKKMKKK